MFTSTSNRKVGKSMTKVIALHSNRGGVGKTLIATNLAMAYANLGRRVCLIDLDFRAPSLSSILQLQHPNLWINDFLDERGKIWDALVDITPKYGIDGRLLVGVADPSLEAIRKMTLKDRRWEMATLRKLMSIKKELARKNIEYVIFDTSPGILYSSVNAVACSDAVVVVTTADIIDASETQRGITELYKAFEKPTYVFMNKAMPMFQWSDAERNAILEKFTPIFNAPIMTIVPCYCDLLNSNRTTIYTIEMPEHPFSKAVYETANKLSEIKD